MSTSTSTHPLFVYGTLKRGGALNSYLEGARYRGEATIQGLLYISKEGWYPRLRPGNGTVHGELFGDVSDALLWQLDAVEGHPYLFERRETKTQDGETVWAYWYNGDIGGIEVLPGGNFDCCKRGAQ